LAVFNKSTIMNAKFIIALLSLACTLILPVTAKDDAPSGYLPLAKIEEAKTKAAGKKLIVLMVKGMDDACPNCAAAVDNGESALGSGVVKLFARAETIGKADATGFSPALQERIKLQFVTGAAVTFLVFNPDMTTLITEASRKELQSDKKAIAAFKKEVQEAKKALK